ncbi:MAG: sugar phosphate isomerase/epimerase [Clostridiales bacterium]|nr:sugar phosphate isomerase/epimerase [Clostridiales bacterium]
MSLKLALQLYSVGADAKADFDGTLKRVSEMGYEGVEFAGLHGYDADRVVEMLRKYGLTPVSAHISLDDLENKFDEVTATYHKIGCPYIAVPYLVEALRPVIGDFEQAIERIAAVAKRYTEAGFVVSYHNHDFEFKTIDGKLALDMLYDRIPAAYLKTQIDTCWANVGGVDPADYVLKYTGRAPTVHIKDFYLKGRPQNNMYKLICDGDDAKEEEGNFSYRPVGYGLQDVPKIMEACKKAGAEWVIVEQDGVSRPGAVKMEEVALSAKYILENKLL